jgi:hypothetical protein
MSRIPTKKNGYGIFFFNDINQVCLSILPGPCRLYASLAHYLNGVKIKIIYMQRELAVTQQDREV